MATSRSISPIVQSLSRPSTLRPSAPYICTPCRRPQQQQQQRRHASKRTQASNIDVPSPTPFVPNVQTFLTLIGRNLSVQASKFPSWSSLFTLSSPELKDLGIEPARTRRYLLHWRNRFKKGDYGVGGDLNFVKDGIAHLRVCEIPSLRQAKGQPKKEEYVSATSTPGYTKLVVNLPEGSTDAKAALQGGRDTASLRKPKDYKLVSGHAISGPFATPVKGTGGSAAIVKIVEGMWEHKLGQKVFGGERRRAETLHKLGVEEHRKAAGTAR